MTSAQLVGPSTTDPAGPASPAGAGRRRSGRGRRSGRQGPRNTLTPGAGLGLGIAVMWFSLLVLIPLTAVVAAAAAGGWEQYFSVLTNPQTWAAVQLTVLQSLLVTAVNVVMGSIIAWVLVRDRFWGKSVLNVIIDVPFALPTIVAGLVLLSLYGPNSPLGLHWAFTPTAVALALAFVTLPFVVRTVQPVLEELESEVEEAAASLGANRTTIVRRIILPALAPAITAGAALSFARAISEYGSLVLLSGNRPYETEVVSVRVLSFIENGSTASAAALASVMLTVALVVIVALDIVQRRVARAMVKVSTPTRWALRLLAIGYVFFLVAWPVALVVQQTFADGLVTLSEALADPQVTYALRLTAMVATWAVLINLVFGVGISLLLVRYEFPGKRVLSALIDVPLSVSPVVVGLALLLVYNGRDGWLGKPAEEAGWQIVFDTPAMVMATCFVALPLVIREVVPVLHEIGDDQEQAARSLGANARQTFLRVTLPSIKWAVVYGVVLSLARSLGEFGAVKIVSGNITGRTQTATLVVEAKYQNFAQETAYATSFMLIFASIVSLVVVAILRPQHSE